MAYLEDLPVGWCNMGPRGEIARLTRSKTIREVDDVSVWSIVSGGYRKPGATVLLIEGAMQYAASRCAPAVEAYPVDPSGRTDTTMACVGTRCIFEAADFQVIGTTDAVAPQDAKTGDEARAFARSTKGVTSALGRPLRNVVA